MLFHKASSSLIGKTRLASTVGRRLKSTTAESSAAIAEEGSGALIAAVATTFATYMTADFLSNFLQHPTQKMDYGYFNQFLGRPVDRAFWGTRTQHIVGVAACLAVTDHTSQAYFSKYWLGDAYFNPDLAGTRSKAFKEGTYSSAVGSCTAWFEPYVSPGLARIAGPAFAGSWLGSSLLPATLAYSTVKGCGWNDWGNSGLNDLEMKMNKLSE